MITLTLQGNTYGIKEELKASGFRWNPNTKAWYKDFEDSDKDRAERLAEAYIANGVTGRVAPKVNTANKPAKKYRVKESWIFNLESIHDKAYCIIYDIEDGSLSLPLNIAGKAVNSIQDVYDLIDEAEELCSKAWRGVTGREYGRIKELVAWRVEQRYYACLASGMSEAKAGGCFADL